MPAKKTKRRTRHNSHARKLPWAIIGIVASVLALGLIWIRYTTHTDTWCSTTHQPTTAPPLHLQNATEYFIQGDYEYERGNCYGAIVDYSRSIELNPQYAEAYNNRGYTFMRLQNYKAAYADLANALVLRPDYVQALMNRGDLYNFYGPIIDRGRAIADYDKVIALGGTHGTSVCGHKLLAENNGWNFTVVWAILSGQFNAGCN